MSRDPTDGGAVLWGHSPALDVQQQLEDAGPPSLKELHAVNVLLAGVGDVRHVLRTIAQTYRHPASRRLHLYVLEPTVEATARQLMMLTLALEPTEALGPVQKARYLLELHGNTLIRPNTLAYLRHKAGQLIYMVTDPSYLRGRLPLVSLDQLKYKERDYLESTYKFWKTATQQDFDIVNFWDGRLRNSLGVRYDARHGLFDWDYHMKLNASVEGGTPVTSQEYIGWRETGVAFRWTDGAECTDINPSLASGTLNQHTYRSCHYSGDQLTGPYIGYGLQCEDEDMLRKYNNQFAKNSTSISERNVTRMMYELAYRKPYLPEPDADGGGAVVHEPLRRGDSQSSTESPVVLREEYSPLAVEDVTVTFLSPGTLEEERPNARLRGTFHVMVLGQSLLPQAVAPPLLGLAVEDALLLLEGRRFVVGPRRCQREEFNEIMLEAATEQRLEPIPADAEYDPANTELMRYILRKRPANANTGGPTV